MTRTDRDGKLTVLAETFGGKKFNTPNDVTVDSKGRIYFSDPCYGDRSKLEMTDEKGQIVEGVYRIDLDGTVNRVHRPRGGAGERRPRLGRRQVPVRRGQQQQHGQGGPQAVPLRPAGRTARSRRGVRNWSHDWGTGRGPDGLKQDVARPAVRGRRV